MKDVDNKHLDSLAVKASCGDTRSLEELITIVKKDRLAEPAIRRILYREDDVDAAIARTLTVVAFKIHSFRSASTFTTWLFTVARNEAKQYIRSESRHNHFPLEDTTPPNYENFIHLSSVIANETVVRSAINQIDIKLRQALLLREYEGYSYEEVANALQINLSTAKTRVRRARQKLAQILQQQF